MTAEQQRQLDEIEKDRRKREKELLLFLLLLLGQSQRYATAAIRLGHDPGQAIYNVMLGNPDLDLRGAVPGMMMAMRDAYASAVKTAAKIIGVAPLETTPPNYSVAARDAVKQMTDAIIRKVRRVQEQERANGAGPIKLIPAVREAFADGFLGDKPFVADAVAVTAINQGYQQGLFRGWKDEVDGLRYVAVLDNRTTPICVVRDRVELPATDAWWMSNTPPMHYNCRSTLLPIMGNFVPTENPPTFPPAQPGFGKRNTTLLSLAAEAYCTH